VIQSATDNLLLLRTVYVGALEKSGARCGAAL